MLASELREQVVDPTLKYLGLYSGVASDLVLGTAAHESHLGEHLVQVGGPALGIYQIEPNTFEDLYKNFLSFRKNLRNLADNFLGSLPTRQDQLVTNLAYATAMCRLLYYRAPEPLPQEDDVAGYARYWKRFYNTALGAGQEADFIRNYRFYLGRT